MFDDLLLQQAENVLVLYRDAGKRLATAPPRRLPPFSASTASTPSSGALAS